MIDLAVMVEIVIDAERGLKCLELREDNREGAVLFRSPTYTTIREKVYARMKVEAWSLQNGYMVVGYE